MKGKLIGRNGAKLGVLNWEALARVGNFDSNYLHYKDKAIESPLRLRA